MKHSRIFTTALLAIGLAAPAMADPLWVIDGFEMPESALFDPDTDQIIVSNIVGSPGEADGKGYLSRVAHDGQIVTKAWVSGLNAPKGMALMDGKLFVADLTQLVVIDAQSGEIVEKHTAEGAKFLNDVASDGAHVYVSDMLGDTIWRYEAGTFAPWLSGAEIPMPNGLFWDGSQLLAGSWGTGLNQDFTTKQPGDLLAIDTATKAVTPLVKGVGNLDGIARIGDSLYVSDWIAGKVYVLDPGAAPTLSYSAAMGTADIGATSDGLLLIPHMLEGKLEARTVAK